MPTVGVGRRAVAIIIDSLLLALPAAPVIAHVISTMSDFFSESTPPTQQSVDAAIASLGWVNTTLAVLVILWLLYMILMEKTYGASLGKFALGIRVVRLDGQPMDGFTSFLRNIIRAVDWLFFYLVGAIIIWNSPLHQRLGDKAAKTVVVPAAVAATYRGGAELPPVPAASGPAIPPRPDR
jgi:uncharacterized RDD family membrane protein YckC